MTNPDVKLTAKQTLAFLGIANRRTLYKWAERAGFDTSRGFYWQSEAQQILDLMQQGTAQDTPEEEASAYQAESADMGGEGIEAVMQTYQPLIEGIAKPVAVALHNQLHHQIAREFFALTQSAYTPPLVKAAQKTLAGVRQTQLFLGEYEVSPFTGI